jgi:hypothetical protein
MAKVYTLRFSECEHQGDLDNYKTDVQNSGGVILDSGVDSDNEEGWMKVSIEDKDAFMLKFKQTDAYGFM